MGRPFRVFPKGEKVIGPWLVSAFCLLSIQKSKDHQPLLALLVTQHHLLAMAIAGVLMLPVPLSPSNPG